MSNSMVLASLGRVRFEPSCVVPDDPGMVVRGARRLTDEDRAVLREQHIARLTAACERGQPRR